MYEYVSKSEYGPAKADFEIIIRKVQKILRNEKGITFQPRLVGSGGRHLITRLIGGNKGFDLDYNLILQKHQDDDPGFIRGIFLNAFQMAAKGTLYKVESSTSAITIKYIDKRENKIKYSCDLAIIEYDDEYEDDGYYIIKKECGKFVWKERSNSYGLDTKLKEIREWNSNEWWNWIKEEYLTVKNSNKDTDKHSFSLYNEAVCNVYNQIQQAKKETDVLRPCIFN